MHPFHQHREGVAAKARVAGHLKGYAKGGDLAQDKAMIAKAMAQHDAQQHGGKRTKVALKDGGAADGARASARMDRAPRARGGKVGKGKGKKATHVNVNVMPAAALPVPAPTPEQSGMGSSGMPMPGPGAMPPMPPKPPMGPPPGMAGPAAAALPGLMPRKRGGAVKAKRKGKDSGGPAEMAGAGADNPYGDLRAELARIEARKAARAAPAPAAEPQWVGRDDYKTMTPPPAPARAVARPAPAPAARRPITPMTASERMRMIEENAPMGREAQPVDYTAAEERARSRPVYTAAMPTMRNKGGRAKRAAGGRAGHYDAGAGSGEGRLEKIANYGKNAGPVKGGK